jgi:REP element-mobilizing transposase RayT
MPDSFFQVAVHIIFSTKSRMQWIHQGVKDDLYSYLGYLIKENSGRLIRINGMEEHSHILCYLPKHIPPMDFIRVIKSYSSRWMHEHGCHLFAWQEGYAAFSVSKTSIPAVSEYIEHQEEHHKRIPFEEEWGKYIGTLTHPENDQ